jgi:hypothetical protein
MSEFSSFSPKPLSLLLKECLTPIIRKQGFVNADLVLQWDALIGQPLATHTRPLKLQWRKGAKDEAAQATLLIEVSSAFALEAQLSAELLKERINACYGWNCVAKITWKQGFVEKKPPRCVQATPPASQEERAVLHDHLKTMPDTPLRTALEKLGLQVLRANV